MIPVPPTLLTSSDKPYRQFPLRLDATLSAKLTQISSDTGIPKSIILRASLQKMLAEIETSGIRHALVSVYQGPV